MSDRSDGMDIEVLRLDDGVRLTFKPIRGPMDGGSVSIEFDEDTWHEFTRQVARFQAGFGP